MLYKIVLAVMLWDYKDNHILIMGCFILDIKIYNKSSINNMEDIKTNSIDLILTSPPYWDIKNYNNEQQLGLGLTYRCYIENLKKNMFECMRVLKEDGFCVFNVADIRKNVGDSKECRPKMYPIHSDIIQYFIGMDFDLYAHTIWKKESVKKGKKGKIIHGAVVGDYIYPPYVYNDLSIEHILVFRKPGKKRKMIPIKERVDKFLKEETKEWLSPVWYINPSPYKKEHPATFPTELVSRIINLYSIKGDTILDPFCGTGTTLKVANELERNSIGYDINIDFIQPLIESFNMKKDGLVYSYEEIIQEEMNLNM